MIVMKFGGTSVQDAACMDQAIDLVLAHAEEGVVLIASALAKMTDALIALGDLAKSGERETAALQIKSMVERHRLIAETFLTGQNQRDCLQQITLLGEELRSSVKGLSILRQCNREALDSIQSFGELLSTTLLAFRIRERGFQSVWLDSRELVKTDDTYGAAAVLFEPTDANIANAIRPTPNCIYVAQGFIGSTLNGDTTTLGRSGSDYSAAIFGAAVQATAIQIWTDVNGIMTTDPRVVPSARTIPSITYEEAAELAFFGAKVVHPATIQPAVRKNIPVFVLNTKDSGGPFTRINGDDCGTGLKAISGKKNITVINITSSRMFNTYGILSRIFHVFEQNKTSVDLLSTSEVSVSLTIDNTDHLEAILDQLAPIGTVKAETGKSILCLVGQGLWRDPAFISRVFDQLKDIPIRMISLGSSDTNLSCVIPAEKLTAAIQALHHEFFERPQPKAAHA